MIRSGTCTQVADEVASRRSQRECAGTYDERVLYMPVRARQLLGRQRASPPPVGAGPCRAASSATGHGIVRGGGHLSRSAHNAGTHPRRGRRCKSRSHTANRSYAAGPCGVCTACRPPYRSWPATVPTEPSAAPLSSPNGGRRAGAPAKSARASGPSVLLVGRHPHSHSPGANSETPAHHRWVAAPQLPPILNLKHAST